MGRFDGILLCTDFDGTLAEEARISAENASAIRAFQAEGGIFTVASGREPSFFYSYRDSFSANAPIIGYNGSIIADPVTNEYLYVGSLESTVYDDVAEILRIAPKIKWVGFYGLKHDCRYPADAYCAYQAENEYKDDTLLKLILFVDAEDSETSINVISDAFSDRYSVYRSWINGIELQSLNDNKGMAVKRLLEYLKAPIRKIVVAGDYENDIPMMQTADLSYATDNAPAHVKACASRVTVSHREHAIAKIISEL